MAGRATLMAGGDAVWLHLDRPRNRMIVHTILWTSAPVDWARVADRLRAHVLPRFDRLRARAIDPPVPLGLLGGPRWARTAVDLDAHLLHRALPAPGGDAALAALVAAEAALPLPGDRPPWRLHAVDGYGTGSALVLRSHHALADGTAIMRLVEAITEPGDGARPETPLGRPTAAPDPLAFDPVTWTDADVLTKLLAGIPAGGAPFAAPLSGRKSVGWTAPVAVADVRRAAAVHGATLNDAGLAAVAGALRRHRDERSAAGAAVAVVPVNLRAPGEAVTPDLGNRFGLVFVPLPVEAATPATRVREVKATMDRIKGSREARMVYDAFTVLGHLPRLSARAWVDAFSRRATAVVTNIRGPAGTVRLGGAPVTGLVLLVPSTGPLGVGISICTYGGATRLGVISDDAVVTDPGGLHHALDASLRETASSGEGGPGVAGEGGQDLGDTVA